MTGSGKTGLVTVLVEEAVRNGVPVIVVDVKGDLPNLLRDYMGGTEGTAACPAVGRGWSSSRRSDRAAPWPKRSGVCAADMLDGNNMSKSC
jgi:Helicase HerA, central domain